MSVPRTPLPSPLAGEGAERPVARSRASSTRYGREAGEGVLARNPSPGSRPGSRPTSPARGEVAEPGAQPGKTTSAISRARQLRGRMTDAEAKLWFALRDRRFAQFNFRRQVAIGPYIADFVCFDARLIVEFDGGQHAESTSDARRDRWFAANDFQVIRFWNHDVLCNLDGVLSSLIQTLRCNGLTR